MRREEKESSERVTSVVLRREASVSSLLFVAGSEDGEESHFHGRMVAKTTTGRFSFRTLDLCR